MAKRHTIAVTLVLAVTAGVAWAGWSDIRKKAEDARAKAEAIHNYLPEEMKKVVGAMCQAGDDNRESAGQSEASSGRSTLNDKLEAYHRIVNEALEQLKPIADDSQDANHSDASSLMSELTSRRDKIDDQTRELGNGAPSLIDFVARRSESARSDHRSGCGSHDLSIGGDSVSCLMQDSDTCTVVEVAFDNGTSIDHARDRAGRAKQAIEHDLQQSSPNSAVSKCKRVETRVDCYKVCPEIDDDGNYRESSATWRERCAS